MTSATRVLVSLVAAALVLAACDSSGSGRPHRSGHGGNGSELTGAAVDRVVSTLAAGDSVGVQVAVSVRGRITVTRAYGLADVAAGTPVSTASRFGVGSVTKQFTAAAVLNQVEAGRVHLESKVAALLPGLGLPKTVTVRQLLEDTSGLDPELVLPPHGASSRAAHTGIARRIGARPVVSAPGQTWAYNNNGYILLGLALEKLTGETYADAVARLASSVWPGATAGSVSCRDRTDLAPAYDPSGPRPARVTPLPFDVTFSAGGVCATASELLRWEYALARDRVVDDAAYRLMRTPTRQSQAAGTPYGMGLHVGPQPPSMVWHAGVVPDPDDLYGGYSAYLAWFPKRQVGIAVLANTAGPGGGVARTIGEVLSGRVSP